MTLVITPTNRKFNISERILIRKELEKIDHSLNGLELTDPDNYFIKELRKEVLELIYLLTKDKE